MDSAVLFCNTIKKFISRPATVPGFREWGALVYIILLLFYKLFVWWHVLLLCGRRRIDRVKIKIKKRKPLRVASKGGICLLLYCAAIGVLFRLKTQKLLSYLNS